MPDREAPSRAVYDHTEDEPRPAGGRRRPVADWGVGEELFDGMPGRRFGRRTDHRIPRGGADDGRRTILITEAEPVQPEVVDEEFASREAAIRARRQHDAVWAGDEPFAPADAAVEAEPVGDDARAADGPQRADTARRSVARDAVAPPGVGDYRIVRGGVEGRRTVRIGGRPPEFHSAPVRRRAVHERVGPRPDRIAAWAFALGLLLILIAILT